MTMPTQSQFMETHFKLESGILEKLAEQNVFASIRNVFETVYQQDLQFKRINNELDTCLVSNSHLQSIVANLETSVDELKNEKKEILIEMEEKNKNIIEMQEDVRKQRLDINSMRLKVDNINEELNVEKQNNNMLNDRIDELLQCVDVKSNQIMLLNVELSEKSKEIHLLHVEVRNIKNEAETLKSSHNISELTHVMGKSSYFEERLKQLQMKLNQTIEEYSEKLMQRDSDIEVLQIEIKCNEKHINLLKSERNLLKENRINVQNKLSEFGRKILFTENDIKNLMTSLEERVNIIDKYHRAQHDSSLETGNKLAEYLGCIHQLKIKLQQLELEKSRLTLELVSSKQESIDKVSEMENKLNLSYKELEIMKALNSDSDGVNNKQVISHIVMDRDLLEKMSPIAANTSKILSSGLTLTDIYCEYTREHRELLNVQQENAFATSHIKSLVKEVDSMKKCLNEEVKENASLMEVNSNLSSRLNDARVEILDLKVGMKELNQMNHQLNTHIENLNSVKRDLSGQLQNLLANFESLSQNTYISTNPVDLPFFSSIAELQLVNLRLLEMIHELESEVEAANHKVSELSLHETSRNIEDKLEMLANEHKQSLKVLEVTTQQRDMYRMLYQQKSGLNVDSTELFSYVNRSESLESSIIELDRVRSSYSDMKQRLEATTKQLDEYKTTTNAEMMELRSMRLKHITTIDELNEKYKNVKADNKMLKDNINSVEMKSRSFEELYYSFEHTYNELKMEKSRVTHELETIKAAHRSIMVDTDNLRMMVKQLQVENQGMRDQNIANHPLVLEFQQISSQLNDLDVLARSGLPSQLNVIREELGFIRTQCGALSSQFQAEKVQLGQTLESMKKELQRERNGHQSTLEKLQHTEERINSMKVSHSEYTFDLTHQPDEVKILIDNLKSNVVDREAQIEQYRTISEAAEKRLSQLAGEQNNLQETLFNEQNRWKSTEHMYLQRIDSLTNELGVYKSSIDPATSQSSSHAEELVVRIEQLTAENQNLSKQYDAAVMSHSESIRRLQDAQSKTETDEKVMNEYKEKINQLGTEVKCLNQKVKDREEDLEKWELKRQEDESLCKQQMEVLYDQIKHLRDQLSSALPADLSGSQVRNIDESNTLSIDPSSDVWKLLEFTRRAKAILQGRLEFSQNECARLVNKSGQLQEVVRNMEKSLQAERECKHSAISSSADLTAYREAVKNLEKVSLEKNQLEKNMMIREKKEIELTQKLQKIQQNVKDLEEKQASLEKSYDDVIEKNDLITRQSDIFQRKCHTLMEKLSKVTSDENISTKYNQLMETHKKCSIQIEELVNRHQTHVNQIAELKTQLRNVKSTLATKLVEMEKMKQANLESTQKSFEETISANTLQSDTKPDVILNTSSQIVPRPLFTIKTLQPTPTKFVETQDAIKRVFTPISATKSLKTSLNSSETTIAHNDESLVTSTLFGVPPAERRTIRPPAAHKLGDVKISKPVNTAKYIPSRPAISRNVLNPLDIISSRSSATQTVESSTPKETTAVSCIDLTNSSIVSGKRTAAEADEQNVTDDKEAGEIVEETPSKKRVLFAQDQQLSIVQFIYPAEEDVKEEEIIGGDSFSESLKIETLPLDTSILESFSQPIIDEPLVGMEETCDSANMNVLETFEQITQSDELSNRQTSFGEEDNTNPDVC